MAKNPFKFGSVVDLPFFTNRIEEIETISSILNSENHLVIISPRRYGKTSLIFRVLKEMGRPYITVDLQVITTTTDLAAQLIKKINRVYAFEKIKNLIKGFRIVPSINLSPLTNEIEVSFKASSSADTPLEDVLDLLDNLSSPSKKLIVVFDEFQEIKNIKKGLEKKLRSVMQHHKNTNYVFLGSQESLIREIFQKKKSPFYRFGYIFSLEKIPESEFMKFLKEKFKGAAKIPGAILEITKSHPYYTQQLAFNVWQILEKDKKCKDPVGKGIEQIVRNHDADYERLWNTLNRTDMKILIGMAMSEIPPLSEEFAREYETGATSTAFSSLKRLIKSGYVVKTGTGYEIDDPFFTRWIVKRRNE